MTPVRFLVMLCVLSLAAAASAQTPTATPANFVAFDSSDPLATVRGETFNYFADGATIPVPLASVACVDGSAAPGVPVATCYAPWPAFTPTTHTIAVSACNAIGCSTPSPLFTFSFIVAVPAAPKNVRTLTAKP